MDVPCVITPLRLMSVEAVSGGNWEQQLGQEKMFYNTISFGMKNENIAKDIISE
jgi:hypothetical protein